MTPAERERFLRVLNIVKYTKGDYVSLNELSIDEAQPTFTHLSAYDTVVHAHHFAARNLELKGKPLCLNYTDLNTGHLTFVDFAHFGSGLLTWHRAFLLWAERMFQEAADEPDFVFPYWAWAEGESGCSVCTNDLVGKVNYSDPNFYLDQGSPISEWKAVCQLTVTDGDCAISPCNLTEPGIPIKRHPGSFGTTMAPRSSASFALSRTAYDVWPYSTASGPDGFRACVEGFAGAKGIARDTNWYDMHAQVRYFTH